MEQPVVRRGHSSNLGIEQHIEHRIDNIGDLFLPVIVVDDNLLKSLEEIQVLSNKCANVPGHAAHERIVVYEFSLLEDKGSIANIAESHKS